MTHPIKTMSALVLAFGLAGCAPKTETAPMHVGMARENYQSQPGIPEREMEQIRLAFGRWHAGEISDVEFVQLQSQIYQALSSSAKAMRLVRDLQRAEEAERQDTGPGAPRQEGQRP